MLWLLLAAVAVFTEFTGRSSTKKRKGRHLMERPLTMDLTESTGKDIKVSIDGDKAVANAHGVITRQARVPDTYSCQHCPAVHQSLTVFKMLR